MDKTQIKQLKREKINSRIWELDFLRGLCVLLMFVDHFAYDMTILFPDVFPNYINTPLAIMPEIGDWYYASNLRLVVRTIVLLLFFIISGICTHFSRSNIKRGSILIELGLAIGILSIFASNLLINVEPFNELNVGGVFFVFNVFIVYGLSLFLYGVFDLIRKKFNLKDKYYKYVVLILALFGIFICVYVYYLASIETNKDISSFPKFIEVCWDNFVNPKVTNFSNQPFYKFFFGLYAPAGHMDYWPIIPWVGLIFLGGFLGMTIYKNRKSLIIKKGNLFTRTISRPILFLGRYAAIFYIIQQVFLIIISGLIYIIFCYA